MLNLFQNIFTKTATILTASILTVSGLWSAREVVIAPEATAAPNVEIIKEEKMPDVRQELQELVKQISENEPIKQLISQITSSPIISPIIKPKTEQPKNSAVATPLVLKNVTAEQFLNRTGISLQQRPDGTYWFQFQTNLSDAANFKWDPASASVGGEKSIPKLDVSFNCNPAYDQVPAEIYSPLSFKIKTNYSCNLTLTDANKRTSQKQFNFTTGPGLMTIGNVSGIFGQTILRENTNTRGVVFTNTDDAALTINDIILDISLTAIDQTKPSVVRFSDDKEIALTEFSLQDIPADASQQFSNTRRDIKAQLSLKIEPHSSKMMFVQALGIHKLNPGVNPSITLNFTKINTDRSDMVLRPNSLKIFWSCAMPVIGAGVPESSGLEICED